ncbi:hypothetical protein [Xanthomonas prunicola]|uniref:Uncharacterized protein n=1 Tax=Xanthomonas prunicola TaxID=2053930 RepID=A0A2N3RJ20_9XANT|nr:hypothetical protein [Xanthomonas prunicola]PKV12495.1 hypothetical protein XpruCFBP8353_11255 [Xanthomonas prunicola]PKV16772.1 hypothetical protein XpruCFBP8354_11255 [Xanthomonas prunicola]PKV20814.1 hypothetical protein CVO74_14260 [Xanthomonas prunicola]
MHVIAKFFKAALLGVCILLAAVLALYAASRYWPIPESQRQALAQLRQPLPPLRGANMFGALWSLSYALPQAQRETVLARDVERFNRLPDRVPFQPAAAGYPRLPGWPSTAPALCTASAGGCLQRVREHPQAYADALATQAPMLARMRALADYADYRSPFRPRGDTPLPELPRMRLSMTASALDFVQGRTTQAFSGVCTDAQVARVLMRSGDNLAITMIGAAMLRGNAQLFADMLAERPVQQSLPVHCAAAFAPATTQEISLCHALHGESRMVFSLLQDVPPPHDGRNWLERVAPQVLDRERTQALLAPTFTWACSAPVLAVLAQDRALPQHSVPVPETTSLACVANASGCLLASVSRPDYANYQHKLQDTAAALRTVSTMLWLRDHPADATLLAQRLAALPPALRQQARPLKVDDDGKHLILVQYARREAEAGEYRWPLPASRITEEPQADAIQ